MEGMEVGVIVVVGVFPDLEAWIIVVIVIGIVIIPVVVADGQVEITNDQAVEGVELDLAVWKEGMVVVDEERGLDLDPGLDPGQGQDLVVEGEIDTEGKIERYLEIEEVEADLGVGVGVLVHEGEGKKTVKGEAITITEEGVEEDIVTAEVAAVVGACNVIETVIVIATLRETGKVHVHQGRNLKHNGDDQEKAAQWMKRNILKVPVRVVVTQVTIIKIMMWRNVSYESKLIVHVLRNSNKLLNLITTWNFFSGHFFGEHLYAPMLLSCCNECKS